MIVSLDTAEGLVHKVATSAEEAALLEREAAVLRVARHPGVVQLRDHRSDRLEVDAVGGRCLEDIGPLSPAEVAGLGCAIATVLADLHDLGIVHGSVAAGHVLVDRDGRPVLCSLGRGRLVGEGPGPVAADDVVALVDLLIDLLPAGSSSVAGPSSVAGDVVRRALRSRGRSRGLLEWGGPPSARRLAARLAAIPAAELPDPGVTRSAPAAAVGDNPPPRPGHRRWAVAAGAVAAVVAVLIGVAFHGRPSPSGCPRSDEGCRPIDHRDGVVTSGTRRFSLAGDNDDPLVVGRWTCGPALPALLRLDRGEVWVWDRWPADGSAAAARLAGQVEGAASLRVVAGASGCDRLSVLRRGGAATIVP